MKNNRGSVILLAIIVSSVILILSTLLIYTSYLDVQITNTSINNTQSSYFAEDKIYLCFMEDKYLEDQLKPMLKHYLKYRRYGTCPDYDEIVLDIDDIEDDDNILILKIYKEEGVWKGNVYAKKLFNYIEKTVIGAFNVINPIYTKGFSILSKDVMVDDDERNSFDELFNEFKLEDFENKIKVIETDDFDKVDICFTDDKTNKIRIDFYRHGIKEPIHKEYLSKKEVFLVLKNSGESLCEASIISENHNVNNQLNGIIYVQGDLNFNENIIFNGIIAIDGGRINVYSEIKPQVNGLLLLNNCQNEEDLFKEKIDITYNSLVMETYGIYLTNFIQPNLYLVKEIGNIR